MKFSSYLIDFLENAKIYKRKDSKEKSSISDIAIIELFDNILEFEKYYYKVMNNIKKN